MSWKTLRQVQHISVLIISKQASGLHGDEVLTDLEIWCELLVHIILKSSGDHDTGNVDERHFVWHGHQSHGLDVTGVHHDHSLGSQLLCIDHFDAERTPTSSQNGYSSTGYANRVGVGVAAMGRIGHLQTKRLQRHCLGSEHGQVVVEEGPSILPGDCDSASFVRHATHLGLPQVKAQTETHEK